MKPTQEQEAIISCTAPNISVNAFAGTGKTSTLVEYAEARPNDKILYMAFNRSTADEASRRFPSNVTARTSHSLAFAAIGRKFQNKLDNLRAYQVSKVLPSRVKSSMSYAYAGVVVDVLNAYTVSSDREIGESHLPLPLLFRLDIDRDDVLETSRHLWEVMKDTGDKAIPMTHDGYLKLYQLSEPALDSRFDIILLDEAQDTNPCLWDIFSKQLCGKVLVGDAHQNIYGFRGSINAMKLAQDSERMNITGSFRFGRNVASKANELLKTFKGETVSIRGLGKKTNHDTSHAHLFRTNAGLFDDAVKMIHKGKSMHFVGGVNGYNFDTIMDVFSLCYANARDVRDPFVRSFKSMGDLEHYASASDDRDILARIKVVHQYKDKIPSLIERIKKSHESDESKADLHMTTAHKSKGKEWDAVTLGGDFPDLCDSVTGLPRVKSMMNLDSVDDPLDEEEVNLIYVAGTRSKNITHYPASMQKFFDSTTSKTSKTPKTPKSAMKAIKP